jgi:hypothetical protein
MAHRSRYLQARIARDVIEHFAPLFAALRERFRALAQEVS